MTTPAAGAAVLACMVEPDCWFDRGHRTAALEACLRCPARRECAREALRAKATWGMWAGIWIDGMDAPTTRRLRAIAADWPPRARPVERVSAPAAAPFQPAPLPQRRPIVRRSVAMVVDARSSGHCEVMATGCTLTADRQLSRVVGRAVRDASSAAEVYGACGSCANAIDSSTALMRRCGYLVASVNAASTVPFHWRSARWVLLASGGELVEISERAVARTA